MPKSVKNKDLEKIRFRSKEERCEFISFYNFFKILSIHLVAITPDCRY